MKTIDALLKHAAEEQASDLHLRVGVRPRYRIDGQLLEYEQSEVMTSSGLLEIINGLLTEEQRQRFARMDEVDFSLSYPDVGRLRCNCFLDHCGPALAIRRIPELIPSHSELHLPASLESLAHLTRGLVLITGATGSGKSSTLAWIVDTINRTYTKHIIILEDPIEYVHYSKKSVVHQRAMHVDFPSFESGLRDAIRQDPDVLLLGELRDLESIRLALSAAEMGVLVFSTLHTIGAAQSVDRIYDVFPAEEQPQIRTMVSHSLEAVVSQILLKKLDGPGRFPATEVLICNSGVRALIREGKTHEISSYIQSGKSHGMHSLNDSVERLVREGKVSPEEALECTGGNDRLEKYLHSQVEIPRIHTEAQESPPWEDPDWELGEGHHTATRPQ